MALQEKFDSALALVKEHNSVVGGEDKPGYVNPDQFIQNLKIAGGTTEERLKGFSYEDILSCMEIKATPVKPILLAKEIAWLFRGKENTSEGNKPISGKKADKMTLRELVEHYDPEESENPVGKRLKEISKGQKFIVFAAGRVIDVDTTVKLLQEVKGGYPGRENIEVNSEIKEVHAIGSLPDNFVEENPLYRLRPLRPDGTCDQTGRSWDGVPLNVRQLIRVAIDTGELDNINIDKAHDIIDIVVGDDAFNKLRKRYRKAAIEFDKLGNLGNLPKLKLVLKKGAGGSNRPFDNAKKVKWITQTGHHVELSDNDLYKIIAGYNANVHKWKS